MTNRVLLLASATVVAAGVSVFSVGVTSALAQPKPSAEGKAAEEKFHSPFGASKAADSAEALDYQSLITLYDEMKGWDAHVRQAQACGDKAELKKMEERYNKAYVAFFEAVKKYVMDWSPRVYHVGEKVNEATRKQMDDNFKMDRDTIVRELEKLRGVNGDPAKCPVKKKHKVYSEDDPRYMEDYPAHVTSHKPAPSHPENGPYAYPYPYPPPQSGDDQPSHPSPPDVPYSPYGPPSP